MSELLIATANPLANLTASQPASPRPNAGSATAQESKANAPSTSEAKPSASAEAKNAEGSAHSTASGESSTATQGNEGSTGSFASVLKKSMNKAADGKGSNGTGKIDPLALMISAGNKEATAEAPAISTFIEQLIPQLAKKSAAGEEEKVDTGAVTTPGGAIAITPIAGPITVAAHNTTIATQGEHKNEGAANNGELKNSISDLRASSLSEDLAAHAAISAEDAQADAGAGKASRLESDFSAVLKQANEQISAAGQTNGASATRGVTAAEGSLRMDNPVGHADWSNELGNKLTWMATAQKQQADLVLNPPQLGRVEISLTVAGDQASANFASPSAEVRELLEDSLPRLREILAGAGINLGEAHVGSESANRFGMQDQKGDNLPNRDTPVAGEAADRPLNLASVASARSVLAGRGMVDMFV